MLKRPSLNWRRPIGVRPEPEPVPSTRRRTRGDCPPGSCSGDWRAQPAEKAPPEDWRPQAAERRGATSREDRGSERNRLRPSRENSQGCGRRCFEPGTPL